MTARPEGTTSDRLADWVALVDACYPEANAEQWDSVGLQVGDPDDAVTAVLLCLDVTDATLDEAKNLGAELLLAHHPLLFRPLARLTPDTAAGHLALRAARQGTAVLAAHTNLDLAVEGTSDPIVAALGLRDVSPLAPVPARSASAVKLVTFVPHAHTAAVLAALAAAGAGRIGAYEGCSFVVAGTGAFVPGSAADPAIGRPGARTQVAEDRVEVVISRGGVADVLAALRAAHPYEEVAYDLYPLLDHPPTIGRGGARSFERRRLDQGGASAPTIGRGGARSFERRRLDQGGASAPTLRRGGARSFERRRLDQGGASAPTIGLGTGRVGDLAAPLPLHVVAGLLAERLPSPHLRYGGAPTREVRRVAACGGAGDALVEAALASGADCYVTGDLRHHVALDARTLGLAVIDAGHYATEAAALPAVGRRLMALAAEHGLHARLLASTVTTEPLVTYAKDER